jgi:hypothetical protein
VLNDNTCAVYVASSQNAILIEQLQLERPIVPKLATLSNQGETFIKGNYVGSSVIQN